MILSALASQFPPPPLALLIVGERVDGRALKFDLPLLLTQGWGCGKGGGQNDVQK